ncbi:hypothetical protein AVEN_117732-1, partial [Araneus ventricosus]
TSSPSVTDWTPGSLCRRFSEDSPLRHLLCSVTHGMGKKLLVVNNLGGSYNIHGSAQQTENVRQPPPNDQSRSQ